MLLQDQLVKYVLTAYGQLFITPEQLQLSAEAIRDFIFRPAVKEYDRWRPAIKIADFSISGDLQPLPADCRRVVKLRRRMLTVSNFGMGLFAHQVPGDEFEVVTDRHAIIGIAGFYTLEYTTDYTFTNTVPYFTFATPTDRETHVDDFLPSRPRPQTLTLLRDNSEVIDDGDTNLLGDWVEPPSSIDYKDGHVAIKLVEQSDFPITCRYESRYPGVVELDLHDTVFLDLFTARFLKAYAAPKSNMQIEGLPFGTNTENVLAAAEAAEARWNEDKQSQNKWWMAM